KQELCTELTTVSYWHGQFFTGIGLNFYIHSKGSAPADGFIMFLKQETNEIIPHWGSCTVPSAIEEMKKRINIIEQIQKKIDIFDPTKNPEFMELLDNKKRADELFKEFKSVVHDVKKMN